MLKSALVLKKNSHVSLIALDRSHAATVTALLKQSKVARALPPQLALVHTLPTLATARSAASLSRRSMIPLGLISAEQELLGVAELSRLQARHYEIGYAIDSAHWNQGLGTQLLQWVIAWAHLQIKAKTLTAFTTHSHPAQVPLLLKQGFVWNGRQAIEIRAKSHVWADQYDRTLK